jgi:hypothetical protein
VDHNDKSPIRTRCWLIVTRTLGATGSGGHARLRLLCRTRRRERPTGPCLPGHHVDAGSGRAEGPRQGREPRPAVVERGRSEAETLDEPEACPTIQRVMARLRRYGASARPVDGDASIQLGGPRAEPASRARRVSELGSGDWRRYEAKRWSCQVVRSYEPSLLRSSSDQRSLPTGSSSGPKDLSGCRAGGWMRRPGRPVYLYEREIRRRSNNRPAALLIRRLVRQRPRDGGRGDRLRKIEIEWR